MEPFTRRNRKGLKAFLSLGIGSPGSLITSSPPEDLDTRVFDASGMLVVPGFIDLHVHLIGGGGEAGPTSRVPEIRLSKITEAGITTLAGLLGTDNVSRHLETLLVKAKALCVEGITTYMYTGSYHLPSSTITGSVKRDKERLREDFFE